MTEEEMIPAESVADDVPAEPVTVVEIAGVDQIAEVLQSMEQIENHPVMTTSFQDYTVTEGLLLLLLLLAVISVCVKILKGGFSWLL